MQLAVPDIERDHVFRAALEEAVREASRRGADVEAARAVHRDLERGQRMRQLLAAPGYEARQPLDHEWVSLLDLVAWLLVTLHEPRQDECLSLGAALGQSPLDEERVDALLH